MDELEKKIKTYSGSPLEKVAMGLLNLYVQTPTNAPIDSFQISVERGKILAGAKLEDEEAHAQMLANGWYFDGDSYVYNTVGEDE